MRSSASGEAGHGICDGAGAAAELNPIRQQDSGVADRKGLWEVHRDPYDASRVFVRGPGGWITCPWKYLDRVPVPFGELAWDHVSGQLTRQGRGDATELERAQTVDDLLRRAYHGPPDDPGTGDGDESRTTQPGRRKLSARDRRVAARTRAGAVSPAGSPALAAAQAADGNAPQEPRQDGDEQVAKVIPLGIFDPFEEARKPW